MFLPYYSKRLDERAARVKTLVASLNEQWFAGKQNEYRALCGDGNDVYVIDHTPADYEQYLSCLTPEERHNTSQNFDQPIYFDVFCFEDGYSDVGISGYGVTQQIISVVTNLAEQEGKLQNDYAYKALCDEVIVWLEDEVAYMRRHIERQVKDGVYIEVLVTFKNRSIHLIEAHREDVLLQIRTSIAASIPPPHPFNLEQLEGIVHQVRTEHFVAIEKELLRLGLLQEDGWRGEKEALVSMILIMIDRDILRKQLPDKSPGTTRLAYRHFFEERYNISISKQMQPAEIKRSKLPVKYKPLFTGIPDLTR